LAVTGRLEKVLAVEGCARVKDQAGVEESERRGDRLRSVIM